MNLCTNADQAINEKDGVLEISLGNVELDQKAAADRPNLAFLKHPQQFGLHGIKPAFKVAGFNKVVPGVILPALTWVWPATGTIEPRRR